MIVSLEEIDADTRLIEHTRKFRVDEYVPLIKQTENMFTPGREQRVRRHQRRVQRELLKVT